MSQNLDLIERIVEQEWNQFQDVNNEGGPANCQGNWPTFRVMRMSQFLTWDDDVLESYDADLKKCETTHRNLLTEKYARMMASTDPQYYEHKLKPYLAQLDPERIALQEHIIGQQLIWAKRFHQLYPHLGENMRVMETREDTRDVTSFETYLRGELSTYSDETLRLYATMIERYAAEDSNITEETVLWTVKLSGHPNLAAAEKYLAG